MKMDSALATRAFGIVVEKDVEIPVRDGTRLKAYHKHTRRLYLKPGEIVQVQVEIWPTSMVFRKGHRIRLDIQPRDGVGSQSYMHYHADYNTGTNTIHAGGDRESFLLLPVIPAKE
jgi:predicted acyl esterase